MPQRLKIKKQGSPKTTFNYRCHLKVPPYVTQRRLTVTSSHPQCCSWPALHARLLVQHAMLPSDLLQSLHLSCTAQALQAMPLQFLREQPTVTPEPCHFSPLGSNPLLLFSHATTTPQGATKCCSPAMPLRPFREQPSVTPEPCHYLSQK